MQQAPDPHPAGWVSWPHSFAQLLDKTATRKYATNLGAFFSPTTAIVRLLHYRRRDPVRAELERARDVFGAIIP
jgi:hypothetical protein